eukprot:SAG22_NODE_430_length_10586_cov_6.817202_9_plen_96_part_00
MSQVRVLDSSAPPHRRGAQRVDLFVGRGPNHREDVVQLVPALRQLHQQLGLGVLGRHAGQAGRQAGRQAGGQAGRRAGGQAGRRAGGQAGRRAGR